MRSQHLLRSLSRDITLGGLAIGTIIAFLIHLSTGRIEATLGFAAGGLLSFINFRWIARKTEKSYLSTQGDSPAGRKGHGRYFLRLFLLFLAVVFLIKTTRLDPLALLFGLFLVQITIFLWQIPKNFLYLRSKKHNISPDTVGNNQGEN